MSNQKFQRDLKQGQVYETKAEEYFLYDTVEHKKGYFKEFDMIFIKDGVKTKVEVKSDRLASKTGNLCIEWRYKGKPSGITSTTADYWLYFILWGKDGIKGDVVKEECYKIPTNKLRQLVKGRRSVKGGDGYNSQLYLLPKKDVKQFLVEPVLKKESVNNITDTMVKLKV